MSRPLTGLSFIECYVVQTETMTYISREAKTKKIKNMTRLMTFTHSNKLHLEVSHDSGKRNESLKDQLRELRVQTESYTQTEKNSQGIK